jgi:hypothetical protein
MSDKINQSLLSYIQDESVKRFPNKFNELIKEKIQLELSIHGFVFNSDIEFLKFLNDNVEKRISRNKLNFCEIYLKKGSEEILLFSYIDAVTFDYSEINNFKITATVFRQLK